MVAADELRSRLDGFARRFPAYGEPYGGDGDGDRRADREQGDSLLAVGHAGEEGEPGRGQPGEEIAEADEPPPLRRRGVVDERRRRRDVGDAPAEAEPEEGDTRPEPALHPDEADRGERHDGESG